MYGAIMPDLLPLNRRTFLAASALSAASAARVYGANQTLNIGVIGCGGRAKHLLKSLVKLPGANVATLCDVWDTSLESTKPIIPNAVTTTKDFRKLLDDKSLDAVLIATPDHWHAAMTIAACEAGKDVYVEKPLTHAMAEGQAVIDAQNSHKRIVQVGTQQRSMPHIAKARELIQAGQIGKVVKVRMSWNRNSDRVKRFPVQKEIAGLDWQGFLGSAPKQPFDEYRFRNWRWFWDFGGGIFTDLMVHWIDVAHWVLNVSHPLSAHSIGEFINAKGIWETPDSVQTLLQYPDGLQMHFEGTFSNARTASRIEFLGTEASVYIDRGRYELIPERNKKVPASEMILGTGPLGADFYDKPDGESLHLQNWLDCIRSRKAPTAPAEAGVSGAGAAHLANVALRSGQRADWAEPKKGR